jgi:hypothetical protein
MCNLGHNIQLLEGGQYLVHVTLWAYMYNKLSVLNNQLFQKMSLMYLSKHNMYFGFTM